MTEAKPDFIVIGAQKSASTFVQHCLNDHPDIFMPDNEVTYFEDPDYGMAPADFFDRLFAGRSEPLLGMKRPSYIGKPEVPPRITADLPEAKLIAVLRNPVDRAVAAYFHLVKYGAIPPVPVEEGLAAVLDGSEYLKQYPRHRDLLEFGFYARHLASYEHFFDAGRMLCLLHDDIAADSLPQIRKCYAFLGVDDSYVPAGLHSRPQKATYSIERLRFLTRRNRFLYWRSDDWAHLKMKKMNPFEWSMVAGITAIDRYVLSRIYPNGKPSLSRGLRQRLSDVYRDDVRRLETMIGRDLSGWIE